MIESGVDAVRMIFIILHTCFSAKALSWKDCCMAGKRLNATNNTVKSKKGEPVTGTRLPRSR